jgi:Ca-activated chloride channel family protein
VKKPVDLVIAMDISGSMSGQKISSARSSLMDFLRRLDDRDRVQIILFNSELRSMTELSNLGEKRDNLLNRVSGISEESGTRLFDAILMAIDELETNGDPNHIRSIVVLSDGVDTESQTTLDAFIAAINTAGKEGGTSIKVMTIAFGSDADTEILKQISDLTGGKMFEATPSTIEKVYSEIATFY